MIDYLFWKLYAASHLAGFPPARALRPAAYRAGPPPRLRQTARAIEFARIAFAATVETELAPQIPPSVGASGATRKVAGA